MSQLKIVSAVLCAGFLLTGAQVPLTGGPNPGPGPASSLQRTGDKADVPLFPMPDSRSAYPRVEVMLNGKGPFRMVLDTGFPMGQVALFSRTTKELDLNPVGSVSASDGSGQARAMPIYRLDHLKIGGLSFSGARAVEISLAGTQPGEPPPFDGVIGMGLFRDLLINIDFKNRRFTASPGSLPEPDGKTILKYEGGPGAPIKIPLKVGEVQLTAVLDTGNGKRPLAVPEKMVADLPTQGEAREDGVARTVSQQIVIKAKALNAPVTFGSVPLPVTDVMYPSPGQPNLGAPALKGMTVTIDQKNSRVRIMPSG